MQIMRRFSDGKFVDDEGRFRSEEELYAFNPPLTTPFVRQTADGPVHVDEYELDALGIQFEETDDGGWRIRFREDLAEFGTDAYRPGTWMPLEPGRRIEIEEDVLIFSPPQ